MHNSRKKFAPNSDPHGNVKLLAGSDNPLDRLDMLLKKNGVRPRKNAVLGVEFMMGFSPEMKGKVDVNEWAKTNMKFIESKFPKGSILSAHLHLDETTPHIQLIVAPFKKKEKKKQIKGGEWIKKVEWTLSARDYFGGKKLMQKWQDDYAIAMEKHDLERGIRGSKAQHKTMQAMYGESKALEAEIQASVQKQLDEMEPGKEPFFGKTEFWKNAYKKAMKIVKSVLKFQNQEMKFSQKTKEKLAKTTKLLAKSNDELHKIYEASKGNFEHTITILNNSQKQAEKPFIPKEPALQKLQEKLARDKRLAQKPHSQGSPASSKL